MHLLIAGAATLNHIEAAKPKPFCGSAAELNTFLLAIDFRRPAAKKLRDLPHDDRIARPTSKMSHDRGWRAACRTTIWVLWFQFEIHEIARGVTDMVVGSGALLGRLELSCEIINRV